MNDEPAGVKGAYYSTRNQSQDQCQTMAQLCHVSIVIIFYRNYVDRQLLGINHFHSTIHIVLTTILLCEALCHSLCTNQIIKQLCTIASCTLIF